LTGERNLEKTWSYNDFYNVKDKGNKILFSVSEISK
jgi:hypothetical protein